jgi:hypothetical protein
MRECDYPPCHQPSSGQTRGLVVQPEPIMVSLCAEHTAVIDSNGALGDADFWRWAKAAMQSPGHG